MLPGPVTITVGDGRAQAVDELQIDVRPKGQLAPTARNDHATAATGQSVVIKPLDNDTDPNGDAMVLSKLTPDALPNATIAPDFIRGTVSFNATKPGIYAIEYKMSDGPSVGTATIRVDVFERGENHAPVAVRDQVFVAPGGTTPAAVLMNDVDLDGDVLVVTAAAATLSATLRGGSRPLPCQRPLVRLIASQPEWPAAKLTTSRINTTALAGNSDQVSSVPFLRSA